MRTIPQRSVPVVILAVLLSVGGAAAQPEFDRRATSIAQALAGIAPTSREHVPDRFLRSKAFVEHQRWMAARWTGASHQIAAIEAWGLHELNVSNPHARTLLYPFSGPDFLNAHALFPGHGRYIFFSLERPGTLPDLEALTSSQFDKLLPDVRRAFRDIFERNYFITDYMSKQLTTPWIQGTVPIMAAMTALLRLRIVGMEPLDLYPELTSRYQQPESHRPRKLLRGVRIDFCSEGGPIQQLYYFSLDASDVALAFYPGFLDWVGQHRPASLLLKSASYLLHDTQFEKTRAMLLTSADVVIQDDTGIPYRFFSQPPWRVRLYGRYNRPIRELRYGYQADLQAAYQAKAGELGELPFSFGYHWKGRRSNLLFATR